MLSRNLEDRFHHIACVEHSPTRCVMNERDAGWRVLVSKHLCRLSQCKALRQVALKFMSQVLASPMSRRHSGIGSTVLSKKKTQRQGRWRCFGKSSSYPFLDQTMVVAGKTHKETCRVQTMVVCSIRSHPAGPCRWKALPHPRADD